MSEVDAVREALEATLEAYREEYRELGETWRHLDGKAQGTAATAGIFLAAAFAFVRDITAQQHPWWIRVALACAIVCLVTSVVGAILALRIRKVPAAPLGTAMQELTEDLLSVTDAEERGARIPDFIRDQMRLWREVNDSVQAENARKGRLVLFAQGWLLAAIGLVSAATVLFITGWV